MTVRVADRKIKDALGQENAFAVVTKGAVAEVREERFGFVKPTVDREVVFGLAPELLCAVSSVFKWVSHRLDLVTARRVVFIAVIPLDCDFARTNVEDHIAKSAAVVFVAERD